MQNRFKVLTVRDVQFKDDRTGEVVSGQQLWVCGESLEDGWNGWEVIKIWIPDRDSREDIVAVLQHDDIVELEFNRRGKAVRIDPVD